MATSEDITGILGQQFAIRFDVEDPGYVLLGNLSGGSGDRTYLAGSIGDGNPYVLKALASGSDLSKEEQIRKALPPEIVGELLNIFRSYLPQLEDDTSPPQIDWEWTKYPYHSEGALGTYLTKKLSELDEEVTWHFGLELIKKMAYMHDGYGSTDPDNWKPIIHNDLHSYNLLVHFANDNDLLPSLIFIDWEYADILDSGAMVDFERYDKMEDLNKLYELMELLSNLNGSMDLANCFMKARAEADDAWKQQKMGPRYIGATYIARRLVPLFEHKIQELRQRDGALDLRTTRSSDNFQAPLFEGRHRERELKHWERMKNNSRPVSNPRSWINKKDLSSFT